MAEAVMEQAVCYTLSMDNDRSFFEEIYAAYALDVKRFIFVSARRNDQMTEDIFQNTWENAWRYLRSLRERDKAKAWLFGIARNEAKRYFTAKHIRFEFPAEIGASQGEGSDGHTSGSVAEPEDRESGEFPDRVEASEVLNGLISRLPEEEQQMLILHYGFGVSLSEIATLFGVNYNTLKSITRRALIRLRAYGEECTDGQQQDF
ncbi:MAG: RNA polymerase sigma factor [Clostridiales Family XIII bacterium]|nr:RNA polymerase sigma factor [Clostridiales Family XIII bacterium]